MDRRWGGIDGAIALRTSFKTVGGFQIVWRWFPGLTEFPQPHRNPVSLTFGFVGIKLRNGSVFGHDSEISLVLTSLRSPPQSFQTLTRPSAPKPRDPFCARPNQIYQMEWIH